MDRSANERGPSADDETTTAERERPIRCAACGHAVTSERDAIVVDGRHDHRCVNPLGDIFDIVCFGAASGAAASGSPVEFFSWFRGTAWQVARCAECQVQLGWRFTGRDAPFFGLIVTRLRSA